VKANSTHLYVARYRRSVAIGSWRWQQRRIESLVARPAIRGIERPYMTRPEVEESHKRASALPSCRRHSNPKKGFSV
jgi:hypothetical protein